MNGILASNLTNQKTHSLSLPQRWLKCPRYGQKLEKFLPFKTPLDDRYDTQVPEIYRFTPEMFVQKWKSSKVKLGMVIDLTKTDRFYDRSIFENSNIKYWKHKLDGFAEAPTKAQTTAFIALVDEFLNLNPLSFIAVHCTHGFNRTGFVICSYLVEKMDWSVEAALEAFANIRPPGIYKQHYVDELFERYEGSKDEAIAVVNVLPDWCHEDDQKLIEELNEEDRPGIDSRQKVFIDSKELDLKYRNEELVVQIFDQPRLGQIQRLAKAYMRTDKNTFIGAQPVSLDKDNIVKIREKPYHLSWKADGTRYLLLIQGRDNIYMLDRDNCVFKVKNLSFPKSNDISRHLEKCLFDGELVVDRVKTDPNNPNSHVTEYPRFLIYDAITFKDQEVSKMPFDIRIKCIKNEIIETRNKAKAKGVIIHKEPFSIRLKEFISIQAESKGRWKKFLDPNFTKSLCHETDGLILQPSGKEDFYKSGRCDDILKWKPPELNTIDFKLVVKKTKVEIGCLQERIGLLYVSGHEQPIDTIQVTPVLAKLDGKIIECKYESKGLGCIIDLKKPLYAFSEAYYQSNNPFPRPTQDSGFFYVNELINLSQIISRQPLVFVKVYSILFI